MSVEDLRSIHDRLGRLQVYIERIPQKVGEIGLKTRIETVSAVFPISRHYDHIVQELKRLLPETIDERLRDVERGCGKLGDPYRAHIVHEVAGLLLELQSFRTACLYSASGQGLQEVAVKTKDDKGYKVVFEEMVEDRRSGWEKLQVRAYGVGDAHGEYQVWIGNHRSRSLSEEEVMREYPAIAVARKAAEVRDATKQEGRMPAMVEMRGLLSRMKELAA